MANAAKQNLKVDVLWPRRAPHQAERREGCRSAICGERLRWECLWFDYGYWSGSFTHELKPPNSDYRWVRDPRKCGRHIRVLICSAFLPLSMAGDLKMVQTTLTPRQPFAGLAFRPHASQAMPPKPAAASTQSRTPGEP